MDITDFKKTASYAVKELQAMDADRAKAREVAKTVYGAVSNNLDHKGNRLSWGGIDYDDYVKHGWEFYKDLAEPLVPKIKGPRLLLMIFKRLPKDLLNDQGLIVPAESFDTEAEYSARLGLVLGIGQHAYKDKSFFPYGAECELGEWVAFARYDSYQFKYNGVDFLWVDDIRIKGGIPNPWLFGK